MGFYSHDDEDVELVQGITANISSLKQQYEAAFAAMYPQKQQGGR